MSDPKYATVTISGGGDYRDGTYRSAEIDIDRSDEDNPFLRVWLEPDDQQEDGNYRTGAGRLDAARVERALRKVIAHLDYDLHKGLESDEETGEDTYGEVVARFVAAYEEADRG